MSDLDFLKEVSESIIKIKKENNEYMEEGSFLDFIKTIKDSMNRVISLNTLSKSSIIEFNDVESDNYRILMKDFIISDWNTCKTQKLDELMFKILKQPFDMVLDNNGKIIELIDDFKAVYKIKDHKLAMKDIEVLKSDNAIFYVTFSDIEEEVINEDYSEAVKVTNKFIFSVRVIYEN